jgi:hypothetical protein
VIFALKLQSDSGEEMVRERLPAVHQVLTLHRLELRVAVATF